jgi:hypothetical protein
MTGACGLWGIETPARSPQARPAFRGGLAHGFAERTDIGDQGFVALRRQLRVLRDFAGRLILLSDVAAMLVVDVGGSLFHTSRRTRRNFKLPAGVARAALDGGKYETLFDRGSFRYRSHDLPRYCRRWMWARLSRHVRRRVCRGWLGYRRARMERVPCRGSSPTSLWLWVRLAPEYASLLPAVGPNGL